MKPKNLQELKAGISREFWKTLKPDVCSKFIGHLSEVIPNVVEKNGEPSGHYKFLTSVFKRMCVIDNPNTYCD